VFYTLNNDLFYALFTIIGCAFWRTLVEVSLIVSGEEAVFLLVTAREISRSCTKQNSPAEATFRQPMWQHLLTTNTVQIHYFHFIVLLR
jgi:hypothetical protein